MVFIALVAVMLLLAVVAHEGRKSLASFAIVLSVFALIAVAGWWQLIHEDPEAYRARKSRSSADKEAALVETATTPVGLGPPPEVTVEPATARLATVLAVVVGFDFVLGVMALFSVPFNRPSGWLPASGEAVYLIHGVFGVVLTLAAVALVIHVRGSGRMSRIVAWMGFSGVAIAGVGGLLTEAQSLVRFFGMTLMFVGPMLAASGYMIPALLSSSRNASPASGG